MKFMFVSAALLAAFSTSAFAHTTKHVKPVKSGYMCPVTGTKVASAKAAFGHEVYKGKTYYFCCPMCKPAFDKNKAGTLANAAKGKYQKM